MKLRTLLTFLLLPFAVSAQVQWTTRNPAPFKTAVRAVAAGNGIYVAVGDGGKVATSTDAQNWQIEQFPTQENLYSVAFANGLFFARGTSGTVFVSDNGHYWLQRVGGGVIGAYSSVESEIAYGNGLYVIISPYYPLGIWTSPDGVTWTKGATQPGSHIVFGAGKFVMQRFNSTSFATSSDGVNWTDITATQIPFTSQITFGAGRFVLRSGIQMFESTDAQNWTAIAGQSVSYVAFVKDRFIASETSTNLPITSTDGVTWTKHTDEAPRIPPRQIAGIGDRFVGFIGNHLYRSDDAVHWTTSGTHFDTRPTYPGIAFAQGRFLTGDGYTSSNGIDWTNSGFSVPANEAAKVSVHSANDRFFLLTGTAVYSSTDGLTGSKSTSLTFIGRDVAYGNNRYVIVGGSSDFTKGGLAFSTDGQTWTEQTSLDKLPDLVAVNFARGLFVAVGVRGKIFTSTDGETWTLRTYAPTVMNLNQIAYGAGRWVIAGVPALTSTDGITWSPAPTVPDAVAIAFANDTFVMLPYSASYNNGTIGFQRFAIATSVDGLHWTYRDNDGLSGTALAYGNDVWVQAGTSGSIAQSSSVNASLAPSFNSEIVAAFAVGNPDDITLSTAATGATPISYQWYKENKPLADQTSASTVVTRWKDEWLSNGYVLVATNSYGAGLTQYRVSHQVRQLRADDSGLVLAAELLPEALIKLSLGNALSSDPLMLGPGPRHFQWYKNGVEIPNADASSITVPHDAIEDLDSIYTVTLTNLFGRVSFDFDLAPQVTSEPNSLQQPLGSTGSFTATVRARSTGGDVIFTWKKDGKVVRTQTVKSYLIFNSTLGDSLTINSLSASDYGLYQLTVTNNLGTVATKFFSLAPPEISRLVNLSVRAPVGTGNDVLIAGFVTAGNGATPHILVRGIGPTLGTLGVSAPLMKSHLVLNDAFGTALASNDQWENQPGYDAGFIRELSAQVGAFPLPEGSRDAAIIRSSAAAFPARFSTILSGESASTGIGLVELYEFTPTTGRLINLSARAKVGTGENVLIAGFVVAGTEPIKLLIRAVGPTLGPKGVAGFLPNPKLTLYDRHGHELHNNDNWNQARNLPDLRTATTTTGAFVLDENSYDAAMVETVEPGVYSVQASSADGASGISLVEIYEVP